MEYLIGCSGPHGFHLDRTFYQHTLLNAISFCVRLTSDKNRKRKIMLLNCEKEELLENLKEICFCYDLLQLVFFRGHFGKNVSVSTLGLKYLKVLYLLPLIIFS